MQTDAKQIRDHFLAAAELVGHQREAYLEAHCGHDSEVRAAVERLLSAHEQPASILERPIPLGPEHTQVHHAYEQPGAVIAGRYKLLQRIGEGGMGSVWMADQTQPVKRRVAVKLIRVERGTSKMILSRFEAERQAIALMDHPHIAKLFDAGTTQSGQPFFVMELVKGIPLTDYCDQHRLSIPQRLALFQQICSAVQHAHQKGIIHRDLKPGNILVESHDGELVTKVIDFGLAKATTGMQLTENTLFTAFGNVMGTPTYMAPEQAAFNAVDVDTRADVYSLGVILYELLTGTTPLTRETVKKAAIDEMLKLIREQEAPKPSSRLSTSDGMPGIAANRKIDPAKLSKLLRGDLDWVVLKALEKDRQRRYETASGLSADIQRHLSNEPVLARPPSAAYRLQKTWQRNKFAFVAGAAIAASLILGLVVSISQAVRAEREASRALSALDELRNSAPAFAEQARALASREQFSEAIDKLEYAAKLRPDEPDYLIKKGDLLQCQFRFKDARAAYRAALALRPDDTAAQANAELCDELLASPHKDGKLSREGLSKLYLAMQQQVRPAAEQMPIARLLGAEKEIVVAYWTDRLKDLPLTVNPAEPLGLQLSVREDGLLALHLQYTNIADLRPLTEMPLGTLSLSNCKQITDFTPLGKLRSLTKLTLNSTKISDLTTLVDLPLADLDLQDTETFNISSLRGMKLTRLSLRDTRVSDLSPLAGMPLAELDATGIPATDYSALAGAPLRKLQTQNSPLTDLSFLKDSPVEELSLYGCNSARGFAVLAGCKSLNFLMLPFKYRELPAEELAAIGALRTHPKLKNIEGSEWEAGRAYLSVRDADSFWKDWDRELPLIMVLRSTGYSYNLTRLSDGTYNVAIQDQPLADLSFLTGMPVSSLWLTGCKVTDLAPVKDLPLRVLGLFGNPVVDLNPLRAMPLEELSLDRTMVVDLSPLVGLPLKKLYLHDCELLADVSPVAKILTLDRLTLPARAENVEVLRKLPNLKFVSFGMNDTAPFLPSLTVEQFWAEYQHLGWLATLRDAGLAPKQPRRMNDGTWEINLNDSKIVDLSVLADAPISFLWLMKTDVSDLRPLRGIPLKRLSIAASKVTDLSPLQRMQLEYLNLNTTRVKDISVLRGMPLTRLRLHDCPDLSDISPIADATEIEELTLPRNAKQIDFLRAFPKLKYLSYVEGPGPDYRPDKTADKFWEEHDATKRQP